MSIRPRHVYFDDDGLAHVVSQARLDRLMHHDERESFRDLAGRRVRFLSLYVDFEDHVPIAIVRVEPWIVAFDDDGKRDEAESRRELQAAVGLLDGLAPGADPREVVPAAARFQTAGFRWKPTAEQVEAAIAAHRLRGS